MSEGADMVICCECGRSFDSSDPKADRKMALATGEWKWVCPTCMEVVRTAVGNIKSEYENGNERGADD